MPLPQKLVMRLLIFFFSFSLLGNVDDISDQFVKNVVVKGNFTTSREFVLTTTGITPGSKITVPKLEIAVKKLYAMDVFEDIEVEVLDIPEGIEVVFTVKETPRLANLEFVGNKKVKEKDIKEAADLNPGQSISQMDIFDAKKAILALYTDRGYNLAQLEVQRKDSIEVRESGAKRNIVDLTIQIDEGKKSFVDEIIFDGNQAFTDSKLKRQMDETHERMFIVRKGKFDESLFLDDLNLLEEFYHNNGYPLAEVTSDTFYHDVEDKSRIIVEIALSEGDLYHFGQTEVVGNVIFESDEILDGLSYAPGDQYSAEELEKSNFMILEPYQEDGYIFANAMPRKEFRGDSIDILFELYEGDRAYVRMINIEGNDRTFEKVIRRELALKPGDVFKRSKLMRSQRNVYYLNYFEDVVPDFDVRDDGQVDLTMEVTEKNVGRFQVGASYNTEDKLVGSIDIGWPNMLGRGYELNLQYEFGKTRTNLVLGFTDPWFMDTPTTVGVDLYNRLWRWDGYYTETQTGGAIRLGRKLTFPDDYFSVYGRYSLQQLDYFEFSSEYNPSPRYDLRTQGFPKLESSARASLVRDSRDSRMFATDGSRNSYAVEAAGHFLGGDVEFQLQEIRSDWYISLHKYLTFVAKARFGFVTNWWGDVDDIPYSERLFPGGISYDGMVRGYNDRSLTPKDTVFYYDSTLTPDPGGNIPLTERSSFLTGGRAMSVYTLEFRIPVKRDQFYISLFADAGNAWNQLNQMNFEDLYKSTGAGVRFVIPLLGVLGFDMAYGYDRPGGGDWEFHFQIGPEN